MHYQGVHDDLIVEKGKDDDLEERNRLIMEYAPQVRYIAGRISIRLPRHVDVADLESVGIIGLVDAIDKFDPTKGIKFKTYAQIRIKGAILDELRARDWMPRSLRQKSSKLEAAYLEVSRKLGRHAEDEEVARKMGVDLEEYYDLLNEVRSTSVMSMEALGSDEESGNIGLNLLVDENWESQSEQLLSKEIKECLAKAIDSLGEQERLVMSLYYYEELTLKEIGTIMEVTESRVCQIHTKAVMRLKAKLKNAF